MSLYEDTVLPILTVGTSSAYISDSDRKLLVELTRQLVEARTKLSSVANPVSDRPQAVRENLQTASSVSASVQYVQAETVATSSSVEVTNQIAGVKDIGDTIILGESKKDLKSSGGINWLKKLFGF